MTRKPTTSTAVIEPVEPSKPADGRARRSQDSQHRIVAAMMELVAGGEMTPSAEQVAARARVGLRSVFRHFNDMDSLYREMSKAIAVTMEGISRAPFTSIGWREQVLELVDRRALAYEKMGPFLRAGQIHRHRSFVLKMGHDRFVTTLRQILHGLLPPDVARGSPIVEAIDLLTSFECWHRLRVIQGLDVARAKRVLKGTIRGLLEKPDREG